MRGSKSALIVVGILGLAVAGCGDSGLGGPGASSNVDGAGGGSTDGSAAVGDGAPGGGGGGDLAMGTGTPNTGVGGDCLNAGGCDPGLVCLNSKLSPTLPDHGVCTKGCKQDSDCGPGAFCGPSLPGAGQLCWMLCRQDGTCADPHQVCTRKLAGVADLVQKACLPGSPTAKDGDPCTTFGDCNKGQVCLRNAFEAPGGSCYTVGCTIGDSSTCTSGAGALCLPFGYANTACLPTCTAPSDCREKDGYVCANVFGPGQPQVCIYPHANVGDACNSDGACGPQGSPWRCLLAAAFPGGYCTGYGCSTVDNSGCPSNSVCLDLPGGLGTACTRACARDADCRSGYACRAPDPKNPAVKSCVP